LQPSFIGPLPRAKEKCTLNSVTISLIALAFVFGGALLGMFLRKVLPDQHVSADSRSLVMLGTGLIGTMSAIVLGMLVSSAKNSYDTQKSDLTVMSAKIILLDRVLAHYGPETQETRELLRTVVQRALDRVWSPQSSSPAQLALAAPSGNEALYDQILRLSPTNDVQRILRDRAAALAMDVGQTRWLMAEETHNAVSLPFLVILVFWFTIIFISFGLYTPPNPTVLASLFVCALSVSAALLLMLEMYTPFHGLIQISSAPLRDALAHLGQ
jgi:hypothetical protein